MLMRDNNDGAFENYGISNDTVTFAGPMGQVGLKWQVSGFGDFSGRANETAMLMRNSNIGAFEVYDISNNTITSIRPMVGNSAGLRRNCRAGREFRSDRADE